MNKMKIYQPFTSQIIALACLHWRHAGRCASLTGAFLLILFISTILLLVPVSVAEVAETSVYAQTVSNRGENSKSSDISTSNQKSEKREPIIPKYEERETPQVKGMTFWNVIRWVFALAIVIGLIYVVMYLLKKGWIQNKRPSEAQGSFNILGHMSIGPKRMLYLVEVANRVLVLGVTESGISTLSEITDKETVQTLKKEALMYETDSRFVQYLKKATSKARPAKS